MPTPENNAAICPFWEKSWEQNIRCECCIQHAILVMRFSDKEKRLRYEDRYCNRYAWQECRYARLLLKKYEDEDNGK